MKIPALLLFVILAPLGFSQDKGAVPAKQPVRGMTISCPGSGRSWGSDAMVRRMTELKDLGVNWITIHPYAGIRRNGLVVSRLSGTEEAPRWLSRPIAEAHRLGLKVMIKPHIAYWGSGFSWRGAIDFDSEEDLKRFFDSYRSWIVTMAHICREADAFVVGTELDRLVGHGQSWGRIIAEVRRKFSGPLTYAANWSDFEKVPFWDRLDVIGIQAYFPLVDGRPDEKSPPDRKAIRAGWERITTRMRRYSRRMGRRICFTELGYSASYLAPYRPWDYHTGGHRGEELKKLCLEEALRAIAREDSIVGSFLWKCFPGRRAPRNFDLHTPAMMAAIRAAWGRKSAGKSSSEDTERP